MVEYSFTQVLTVKLKGIKINSQFLFFFVEKSIPYVQITVSKKNLFQNSVLNMIQTFIFIVTIMSKILINV